MVLELELLDYFFLRESTKVSANPIEMIIPIMLNVWSSI